MLDQSDGATTPQERSSEGEKLVAAVLEAADGKGEQWKQVSPTLDPPHLEPGTDPIEEAIRQAKEPPSLEEDTVGEFLEPEEEDPISTRVVWMDYGVRLTLQLYDFDCLNASPRDMAFIRSLRTICNAYEKGYSPVPHEVYLEGRVIWDKK